MELPKPNPVVQTAGKVGKSHHEYFKVMNSDKNDYGFRKITEEELFEHRTKESAWLSLNGIVYDVTIYINYHPGGDILLEGCGIECADLFSNFLFIQTFITLGLMLSTCWRSTALATLLNDIFILSK